MSLIGTCYGINATQGQAINASCAKTEMAEIPMALRALELELSILNSKIQSISKRLEPVLTPEQLKNDGQTEQGRLVSPFAGRINSITTELVKANAMLEDLTKRLEV